ncbi:MAG: GTPase HflX [Oscillospiraceae bacterium]|nr:GTPase HflX [Oscillospiraceae bacterium]
MQEQNNFISYSDTEMPKCALCALINDTFDEKAAEISLDELSRLVETAGGIPFARITQARQTPDPTTYFGSGKLSELKKLCEDNAVTLTVFDDELSPSQIKNIEDAIGDVRVIDRTMLILDIFAKNAKTSEGMLQVEIAGLRYTAPRLIGKGTEMSRLGGGIGTRGPGESKLETDKRHIKRRILFLEQALKELEGKRSEQRKGRKKSGLPQIAIAGYTNSGKSTLLNKLTDAGILAEDKLFATLDPTTRKLKLPNSAEVLMTDTVGFISRLPHHLIKAFKSTLDEVTFADVVIVLLDASDPQVKKHFEVSDSILLQLFTEAGKKYPKTLYVFNKCDLPEAEKLTFGLPEIKDSVFISAKTGEGIQQMLEKMEALIFEDTRHVKLRFPSSEGQILNSLYKLSAVRSTEYDGSDTIVEADIDEKTAGIYKKYII